MTRNAMRYLPPSDPFVLLENSRDVDGTGYLFEHPVSIVRCEEPQEIDEALAEIEAGLDQGLFAAGWIGYEVGLWLEPRLRPLMPADRAEPLIWMGLFETRQVLDRLDQDAFWQDRIMGRSFSFSDPALSMDRAAYVKAFDRVQAYLNAGDIYQANLTMEATGTVTGDPMALHAALRLAQPVAYGAFISTGDWCVSSHSPELFVALKNGQATVKPMKGTAPRGRDSAEDDHAMRALRDDLKSQAENLMIVDLERNDLSRLARLGSVETQTLFDVEALPTALQMTSTITADIKGNVHMHKALKAIFPCGSVTGAPKIRAMEIIAELEQRSRGVYTGAIGQLSPSSDARFGDVHFNVPIRTLAIDKEGRYRYGVGSGVVADSGADEEYDECLLKMAFLTAPADRPSLIETLRYDPGEGYWLLDGHLNRLSASAQYLGYAFDLDHVADALDQHASCLTGSEPARVRLLLSPSGAISVSSTKLADVPPSPTAAWAAVSVISSDPFLFHKTTRRALYNRALETAAREGHWDLIFVNEKGEVTEGARSTIFIERDGVLQTPPLRCGLLPGVLRNHLLEDTSREIQVASITPEELRLAQCVYMGNALYGLIKVEVCDSVIDIYSKNSIF